MNYELAWVILLQVMETKTNLVEVKSSNSHKRNDEDGGWYQTKLRRLGSVNFFTSPLSLTLAS